MSIRERGNYGFFILQKSEFDCFNYYYSRACKYMPRVTRSQNLLNVIELIKRNNNFSVTSKALKRK